MKTWSEIKKEQLNNIKPYYDKEQLKKKVELSIQQSNSDLKYFQSSGIDGSVIIGYPDKEEECFGNIPFMFGFAATHGYEYAYLDSASFFEEQARELFLPLIEAKLFSERDMESVSSYTIDPTTPVDGFPTSEKAKYKEMHELISTVIGESFSNPNDPVLKYSTDLCKEYLSEKYSIPVKELSRTSKKKFGSLEYRTFEDKSGESFTIVVYKGRVISSYPFTEME